MELNEQINKYFSLMQEWNVSYAEYAKFLGLSYLNLEILRAIYEHENCTQKFLSEYCFLPKQTVNIVITQFLKNGIIELAEIQNDRRSKSIQFTAEGKSYAQKVCDAIKQRETAAMLSLNTEERDLLLKITEKYIKKCNEKSDKQ